jgi:2-desacetyl-2-hydroxyethyl bacteriochlorophyllide A dehydrogenase
MKKATALYFLKQNTVQLREESLPSLKNDQVLIETKYSAISAGSEMLIYHGLIPENVAVDATITALGGQMKFPFKYGYALVGKIVDTGSGIDKKMLGRWVFVFHPHQTQLVTELGNTFPIPPGVSPLEALFFPNLETAISLVMDARPVLGEKIVIFGQGVVGLLTTALLARIPQAQLIAIDPIDNRLKYSRKFGADQVLNPTAKNFQKSVDQVLGLPSRDQDEKTGADLIFELSGNPAALNSALQLAGYQARIVVGSWYGNKKEPISLGTQFHRNRLQIISSQVSTIHPALRGRWNKQRRFELVWRLLPEIKPLSLISHRIPFLEAATAYQLIDRQPAKVLQVVLTY